MPANAFWAAPGAPLLDRAMSGLLLLKLRDLRADHPRVALEPRPALAGGKLGLQLGDAPGGIVAANGARLVGVGAVHAQNHSLLSRGDHQNSALIPVAAVPVAST